MHVHDILMQSSQYQLTLKQAGTLYGLWGTLLVANGIIFSPMIDLLGEYHN